MSPVGICVVKVNIHYMIRLSLLAFFHIIFFNGICQIGIGTSSPNTSAALDITSNTKGFLPPRMTAAQRTAISSPAEGLLVFQTNETTGLWFYSGGQWKLVTNSANTSTVQQTKVGFSSSATWTVPSGVYEITVELWGGAGGGGGSAPSFVTRNQATGVYTYVGCFNGNISSAPGGRGGAGGYNSAIFSVTPGEIFSVVIGPGGQGGSTTGNIAYTVTANSGQNGQSSSFNGILIAPGGIGGTGSTSTSEPSPNCFAGINGTNGSITNYTYTIANVSTRSYIPQTLLTQSTYPTVSVAGGAGGIASGGANGAAGNNGSNGEDGFCMITF